MPRRQRKRAVAAPQPQSCKLDARIKITAVGTGGVIARVPLSAVFCRRAVEFGGVEAAPDPFVEVYDDFSAWLDNDRRPVWSFKGGSVEAVRALCREVFGLDDRVADAECVSARVGFPEGFEAAAWARDQDQPRLALLERELATLNFDGSYMRAAPGDGVEVLAGGFRGDGWPGDWSKLLVEEGTCLLVHGLPRDGLERLMEEGDGLGGKIEIVSADSDPRTEEQADAIPTEPGM